MYQKIIILHGSQQKKYPEPIPAGTKITVSWKDYTPGGENNPAVDFRDAENKVVKSFEFPNGQNTYTFTSDKEIATTNVYANGYSHAGSIGITTIINNLMVNIGEVKPYEEYGAMPSVEFPSEIKSCENSINFTICNKNLLKHNANTQTISGITFTVNKDKSITANGTATANVTLDLIGNFGDFALSLKAGDYVLSGCTNGSKDTYMIEVYDKTYYRRVTDGRILINFAEDVSIRAYIAIKSGVTMSNVTFYPMLERNTEKTNYIEHKEQNYTFPLKQKLHKEDYLTEDGIHHNRKEIELDGATEKFKISSINRYENSLYYCTVALAKTAINGSRVCCSHFKNKNQTVEVGNCYITGGGNILVLVLEDQTITTAEQANNWLAEQKEAGTAVTVNYLLATEELEEYSAEQKAIYDEIMQTAKAYKEKTHIYSTDPISPKFDVEYCKDLECYINSKLATTVAETEE